ncbi:GtrA family protein [Hydrogenophaga sp. 5NK40-0174]|uniref:GtrA family protein n=1 Tax=Hydrogenophaga sp. 5NK40-0174 TaxID=3127649 RepID=UPI003104CD4C
MLQRRWVRYLINGVVATCVHYAVLALLVDGAQMASAGLANLLAACVGIAVSFAGNRWFVFRAQASGRHWTSQGTRFVVSYGLLALVHGAVLAVWTDVLHWDYRLGFLLALCLQVVLGYAANRFFVFADAAPASQRRRTEAASS